MERQNQATLMVQVEGGCPSPISQWGFIRPPGPGSVGLHDENKLCFPSELPGHWEMQMGQCLGTGAPKERVWFWGAGGRAIVDWTIG